MKYLFFSIILFFYTSVIWAQDPLSPQNKREIIEELARLIRTEYVESDLAEEMSDLLEKKYRDSDYVLIHDPEAFADSLTEDLQAVCHDFHLKVYAGASVLDVFSKENNKETDLYYYNYDKEQNFGFAKTEHLAGNIGYVRFDDFSSWEEGLKSAAAAFQFVRHTDALIIDLRENTGGSPEMYENIASYFFDRKSKVSFSSIYFRSSGATQKLSVQKKLPGIRLPDKPLYLLIGPTTGSAAEAMAYDLKQLQRATLVGETTLGGANPAQSFALPANFRVMIPIGKAINPITGKNWEGVGVEPDEEISADLAYEKAYLMALSKASSQVESLEFERKQLIEVQELKLFQATIPGDSLQAFEGNYEGREIRFWEGRLYYRNPKNRKDFLTLFATPEGYFVFDSPLQFPSELPGIHFILENGKVKACEMTFVSGNKTRWEKEN